MRQYGEKKKLEKLTGDICLHSLPMYLHKGFGVCETTGNNHPCSLKDFSLLFLLCSCFGTLTVHYYRPCALTAADMLRELSVIL